MYQRWEGLANVWQIVTHWRKKGGGQKSRDNCVHNKWMTLSWNLRSQPSWNHRSQPSWNLTKMLYFIRNESMLLIDLSSFHDFQRLHRHPTLSTCRQSQSTTLQNATAQNACHRTHQFQVSALVDDSRTPLANQKSTVWMLKFLI